MYYLTKKSSCIIIMISIIFWATVVSECQAEVKLIFNDATIVLGVTSIIHRVLAMQELSTPVETPIVSTCRQLISQENYFVDNEENGSENFKKAFKELSIKQINNKFENMNPRNGQRHYLTKMYFLSLVTNHGLDLSEMKTPDQWCEQKLKEVPFNLQMYDNESERKFDCLGFTGNMLKNAEKHDPKLIFEKLYKKWNPEQIRKLKLDLIQSKHIEDPIERNFFHDKLSYSFEVYTEAFFKHYERALDNLNPANFISIKQFCEDIGHLLIQGSTSNVNV